jgi:(4S)-4-hydroxy-5-phosphonooxypentane-2,3-dione isomerase
VSELAGHRPAENRDETVAAVKWVVTVEFTIRSGYADRFLERVTTQAVDSLFEPGCSQFDVCVDPSNPHRVFLYEVYADQQAFAEHLGSAHFKEFNAATRAWVTAKAVGQWQLGRLSISP